MDPLNNRLYNPKSVVHDNTVKTIINVNVVETIATYLKDLNHEGNSLLVNRNIRNIDDEININRLLSSV